jgi:hypothetical protein
MSVDIQLAPVIHFEPGVTSLGPSRGGNLAASALRAGSLVAFIAILLVFSLTAPYFLSIGNIGNVLGQSAISGVLAIGLTIVLIAGGSNVVTGGIDLSLAANMGLSAAVYATAAQLGYGDATAVAAALLTGVLIGSSQRHCRRRRRHRAALGNACRDEHRCRPRTGADAEYRHSSLDAAAHGAVVIRILWAFRRSPMCCSSSR